MTPLLSILVPTTNRRFDQIKSLLTALMGVIERHKLDIEILVNYDTGETTIGQKRQQLLEKSGGEYVLYIDDDDQYEHLLAVYDRLMAKKPDVLTYNLRFIVDDVFLSVWRLNAVPNTMELKRIGTALLHITPVKRTIALAAGFDNMSKREDLDYSMRVSKLVKQEAFINEIVYIYNCKTDKTLEKPVQINLAAGIYSAADYLAAISTAPKRKTRKGRKDE